MDLILVNKPESVLVCGVGEPVLEQNIRYCCPVFAIFTFCKPNISSFKRHMWFYDPGNYNDFRQHLSNTDWDLLQNDDINVWVPHFTNYLLDTCKQFIPNRVVTVRPNDLRWFTSDLKRLIRKRKRLYRQAKRLITFMTG